MSTQERAIVLSHVPDDTGYRLIELPMELQSLLESDAAPTSVPYQATIRSSYHLDLFLT